MTGAIVEEPMLSRLNRLDNILKQLEDIRSANHSPKSSYASTTSSSGTLTSDGKPSWADFPGAESLEKHCLSVDEVMMEVERKGTLIERLIHAEDRILKLCLQMEEGFEAERSREQTALSSSSAEKKYPRKGLKSLVKSFVGAKGKTKHKNSA